MDTYLKKTINNKGSLAADDKKHKRQSENKISFSDNRSQSTAIKYQQNAIQLKLVEKIITGITHLVEIKGRSIFAGNEYCELQEGTKINIDTLQGYRSRRGPNQEIYKETDRTGKHIYCWFKVLSIGDMRGETPVKDGIYVREDSFVGKKTFSKISTDVALNKTYREAQSLEEIHKLEHVAKRLPNVPVTYEKKEGAPFGIGGTSKLYEMQDHPEFLVKEGGGRLSKEALGLIQIEMAGLPCVYAAQRIGAIIVKKIDGVGSKDVIGRIKQPKIDNEKASFITEKTIKDLDSIYSIMVSKKMNIGDFQFIIQKSDGAVFLNDPVSVTINKGPSENVKNIIEKFKSIYDKKDHIA